MKRWHVLAACVVGALALFWMQAASAPAPPGHRSVPRRAEVRADAPPAAQSPTLEAAKKSPPPAAPAPTIVAVVEPAVVPGPAAKTVPGDHAEDATEAWARGAAEGMTAAERASLDRHLTRFVRESAPATRDPDGSDSSGTRDAKALVAETAPLPKADADAAEKRRVEQLELLRQRKAIGLLDHIDQGLAWLALHQGHDGRITDAAAAARCAELGHKPACGEARGQGADHWAGTAATGFSVIALLDFRDQDKQGVFEPTLARAVSWLRGSQAPDGSFPGRAQYSTAIALLALAEAASSSGSDELREVVRRGLRYLAPQQGLDGGYRYRTGDPGDLSVTAWVAQAVEAARRANVEIPPAMDEGLPAFLDRVWLREHRFSYLVGGGERPSLDPAGMLTGLIVWKERSAGVLESWRLWLKPQPTKGLYSLYYGMRVVIALEPELPEPWRRAIFALAAKQKPKGPAAGSFEGDLGAGVVVETAFSVLTLEHALHDR